VAGRSSRRNSGWRNYDRSQAVSTAFASLSFNEKRVLYAEMALNELFVLGVLESEEAVEIDTHFTISALIAWSTFVKRFKLRRACPRLPSR
jgi:hypothetical protein